MRRSSRCGRRRHDDDLGYAVERAVRDVGSMAGITSGRDTTVAELCPGKCCHAARCTRQRYQRRRNAIDVAGLARYRIRDRNVCRNEASAGLGRDTVKGSNCDVDSVTTFAATGDAAVTKGRICKRSSVCNRKVQTGIATNVTVLATQCTHRNVIAGSRFN